MCTRAFHVFVVVCWLCAATLATAAAPQPLAVTVSAVVPPNTTDFITGVTMDFWPVTKAKWGTAGALTVDLTNKDLRTLARGLNGSVLRLGGSPADFLLYEVEPGACSPENLNKTQQSYGSYFCPIWLQAPGQCLSLSRWRDLLEFAADAGLRLVLDLNACWGRTGASADMDWSQIDGLLNYTATGAATWASALHGFEFGNEVYSNIAAPVYGAAITRLHERTRALWTAAGAVPPVIMGPDCSEVDLSVSYWQAMLKAAAPGTLHAITVHDYGVDCTAQTAGNILNVSCLDDMPSEAAAVAALARPFGVPVINGESALAGNSGSDGLTNTFVSTLYFLNELGSYARAGMAGVFRQTLIGGDYELVNKTEFTPNPDYVALLLWRAHMGGTVIDTAVSNASAPVRAYTHCAVGNGGGVSTVLINFSVDDAYAPTLSWASAPAADATVDVYLLSPLPRAGSDPGPASAWYGIALNGARVTWTSGGTVPPLTPRTVSAADPVLLPGCTAAIVVRRDAGVPACM